MLYYTHKEQATTGRRPERKIDMIELAIVYVSTHGNTEEVKNDAANIYASNYEEYLEIWEAVKNL